MSMSLQDLLAENTMPAAYALVQQEEGKVVRCVACAHRCRMAEGKRGICKVRFNQDGELRVPAGYVAGLQADPIEKKPFYHAYPGQDALSFGMLGCDMKCSFCQNWVSSQVLRDPEAVAYPRFCSPQQIVELGIKQGTPVIVSTYNEPLITADWAMQVFELARIAGMRCGFVSNGHATPEVLEYIRPCVDLYKVDLKCHNEACYKKLGAKLGAVLDTIARLKTMGFWVEVVTLIVPGMNNSPDELGRIAAFIADVSTEIPWHVTAYHPDYKYTESRMTSSEDLKCAYEAGKAAGLEYIYAGNLPGRVGSLENTYCPKCDTLLIQRQGFYVLDNEMKGTTCPNCAHPIPGVWEEKPPRTSKGAGLPRAFRI